jgi:hypothetical protein
MYGFVCPRYIYFEAILNQPKAKTAALQPFDSDQVVHNGWLKWRGLDESEHTTCPVILNFKIEIDIEHVNL